MIDIGAGTGNSTGTLLDRGFPLVTAVEYSNGMVDKIRSKMFDASRLRVVKARAESVGDVFKGELGTFDGATMVNVLYSVERPYECLVAVHSLLKPGGRLGLSTTHSETSLAQLLQSIERHVLARDPSAADEDAFVLVRDINRRQERVIARRVSIERYREMVTDAGFEITKLESTYEGAVIVIHAVKK